MEENSNSFVEKIRNWNLETIYYLIKLDKTVQIENLSNLERTVSKNNFYYKIENKPDNYKASIIEVIKYLKENERFNNEFLINQFKESSSNEKSMHWKIICQIKFDKKIKKEFLLWAPYNRGLFVINSNSNMINILHNTLTHKASRLSKTSSNIMSNIEDNVSITIYFTDKILIDHTSINIDSSLHSDNNCNIITNKFSLNQKSKSNNYPIAELSDQNITLLKNPSTSSINKKYQITKSNNKRRNNGENKMENNKFNKNIGLAEDFNLINLNIPTFDQTIDPLHLMLAFEDFGKELQSKSSGIDLKTISLAQGLVFTKLEECINWKLGKLVSKKLLSDCDENDYNFNLDIDQVSSYLDIYF